MIACLHRYSLVILRSFVTLDVKLPPLQDVAAVDAGDDHHQALHDALVQPLCKKPGQSLKAPEAGTPPGAPPPPARTFHLLRHVVEVVGQLGVRGDQQGEPVLLHAGEGLGGVDAPLVQDAVDSIGCTI